MKNILTPLFFVFISYLPLITFAQSGELTITGKILDQENNEPIIFASVYLKGQTIGTTSNEEGRFVFHIPSSEASSTMVVSSIGYGSFEKRASDFAIGETVYLSTEISDLAEVVITPEDGKEPTAKQIVRKAHAAIGDNYPDQPYLLEGFIRDLQKEDEQYVEYLECAAKFYYRSTSVKRDAKVELVEVRNRNIAEKNPWNDQWDRKNSIIDLIEDDPIRYDYGPITGKGGWKYEIEAVLPYNNRYVYKIKGREAPFQTSTLYIDTESFAFVRIELTRAARNGRSWRRKLTNGQLQVYYNLILEYQEYNGKMYLKYQKEEDTWEIYDTQKTSQLLFTQNPKKELFINNIVTDGVDSYPFQQNMDSSSSIESQQGEYNAKFWSTYNAPVQTQEMSKIEEFLKEAERQ
ncbi:MAG: carboxypeptidase-like regulatory domain-containing protein [Bacteroidota bacterium]